MKRRETLQNSKNLKTKPRVDTENTETVNEAMMRIQASLTLEQHVISHAIANVTEIALNTSSFDILQTLMGFLNESKTG
jgi:hypothetical protein